MLPPGGAVVIGEPLLDDERAPPSVGSRNAARPRPAHGASGGLYAVTSSQPPGSTRTRVKPTSSSRPV